jgi:hypothetical protein
LELLEVKWRKRRLMLMIFNVMVWYANGVECGYGYGWDVEWQWTMMDGNAERNVEHGDGDGGGWFMVDGGSSREAHKFNPSFFIILIFTGQLGRVRDHI